MNMYCETCHRDDICLCDLPDDPTAAAVEILDAARAHARYAEDGGPAIFAYDGPYSTASLRPCVVTQKAPYRKGNAPNGAYVSWLDLPHPTPSFLSQSGWTREQFRPLDILTHAIVHLAGSDGPIPD